MIKGKPKGIIVMITGSVVIGLLILSIGLFSIHLIEQTAENTHNIYHHSLAVSNAANDIKANINAIHRSMKDVVLAGNNKQIEEAVSVVLKYEKEVYESIDVLYKHYLGDMKDVNEALLAFKDWKEIREEVINLKKNGESGAAAQITKGKGAEHVKLMIVKTQGLSDFANSKAHTFYEKSFADNRTAKVMMYALMVLALVIGLMGFFILNRGRIKDQNLLLQSQKTNEVLNKTQMIAKLGSYEYNPNTGILIWSDELFELLGYKAGAIKSKPSVFIDQIHPDDKERVGTIFKNSIDEKIDYQCEFKIIKKDKSELYVQAYGRNRYDQKGEILSQVGYIQDITERKKLEIGLLSATIDGQERERNRLAGELHDGLALLLSTAKLNLEAISNDISPLSSDKRRYYSTAKNLLDESIIEVRAMINNLSPPVLNSMSLCEALYILCDKLNTASKTDIQFYDNNCSICQSISKSKEINLYRTAQEMLNNAIKHANANKIILQLIGHKNSIMLIVEDDGVGFDKEVINIQKGNGLKSLISRTKSMGGLFNLDSAPGLGTVISVEIPAN